MSEELDTVASTQQEWLADDDVEPYIMGVHTRNARTRNLVQRGLADRGAPAHVVAGDKPWTGPTPALLTMHLAKGLEFRKVILFGIDGQRFPSRRALGDMPAEEQADVTDREQFLLYVAGTRLEKNSFSPWRGRSSAFLVGVERST
jgi:superfamily I DNA/RNA helicase